MGEGLSGLRPGSREDFDRLYLATHPRLVRTLTAILGDAAAAEDCTQDAFVRAWRAWPRWRPEAPAEAWLYRIALNVAFSRRRRGQLRELRERLLGTSAPAGVEQWVATSPIRQALARLPVKEAAAVMLRHYHGYSRIETARILGISERAVNLRLVKAQGILARELGEDRGRGGPLPAARGSAVPMDEDVIG